MYSIGLIVISDSCHEGNSDDRTGPALVNYTNNGRVYEISSVKIVPDDIGDIQRAVLEFKNKYSLILTAGGTGFSPRDVTPEVRACMEIVCPTNKSRLSNHYCKVKHPELCIKCYLFLWKSPQWQLLLGLLLASLAPRW